MQVLHDLIGQLQAERDVIDERLRLAAALLNTYDPTDPANALAVEADEVPVVAPAPEPKPKAAPKKKPQAKRVTCPDCGEMFDERGLGPHRARKHPGSAAKPLRSVPGHRDPRDDFGDEFFACSTCNHEEPNLNGLKRHTLVEHGRPVNDVERTGIAA